MRVVLRSHLGHRSSSRFKVAGPLSPVGLHPVALLGVGEALVRQRRGALVVALGRERHVDPAAVVAPVEAGRRRLRGGALAELAVGEPALPLRRSTNASYSRPTGTATVFDVPARNPSGCSPTAAAAARARSCRPPPGRSRPGDRCPAARRPSARSRGAFVRPRPTRRAGRTTPPSRVRCARGSTRPTSRAGGLLGRSSVRSGADVSSAARAAV